MAREIGMGEKSEAAPREIREESPLLAEQIALAIHAVGDGEESPDYTLAASALALLTFARRVDPTEHPVAARWATESFGGEFDLPKGRKAAFDEELPRLEPLARKLLERVASIGLWVDLALEELEWENPVSRLDTEGAGAGFFAGLSVAARMDPNPKLGTDRARSAAKTLRAIAEEAAEFAKEHGLEGADVEIVSFLGLGDFEGEFRKSHNDLRATQKAIDGKRRAEEAAALSEAAAIAPSRPRASL